MYGFEGEVLEKYGRDTFELFNESFKVLPLAHVINTKILVLHGGLFHREGVRLEDIQKLERRKTVPKEGLMCDLLWSDPCDKTGRHFSSRGLGINFGYDVTERFLDDNDLDYLIRSHEVKD